MSTFEVLPVSPVQELTLAQNLGRLAAQSYNIAVETVPETHTFEGLDISSAELDRASELVSKARQIPAIEVLERTFVHDQQLLVHSSEVALLSAVLMARLGRSVKDQLTAVQIGLVHDVAKTNFVIEHAIATDGELSHIARKLMEQHVAVGKRLAGEAGASPAVVEGIERHHSRLRRGPYGRGRLVHCDDEMIDVVAAVDHLSALGMVRGYRPALASAVGRLTVLENDLSISDRVLAQLRSLVGGPGTT